MKKPLRIMLFIAAALAVCAAAAGTAAYAGSLHVRPFDGEAMMRVDVGERTHCFTAVVDQAQALFGSLYRSEGVDDPFDRKHDVWVSDFFADVRKGKAGYTVKEILMTIQFQQDGFLYSQQLNIRPDTVTSYIGKQRLDTMPVFEDAPAVGDFTGKLDRLDFAGLSGLLPECDGYMIDMMQRSDVLHRSSPGGVTRYLANGDGSFERSGEDVDAPIGAKVPVITMIAAKVSGNTYGGDTAIEAFLNN